eukprot:1969376-Lingulodinium_polyedra.AAC.1
MWPAEGPRWTPPPRQVDDKDATASWQRTRCQHCREQRRVLVARRALPAGEEVTVPRHSTRDVDLESAECRVM